MWSKLRGGILNAKKMNVIGTGARTKLHKIKIVVFLYLVYVVL